MTNDNQPITPPDDLVAQWIAEIWHEGTPVPVAASDLHLAAKSSQWGYEQRGANNEAKLQKARDEELDACVEWVVKTIPSWAPHTFGEQLRAARRPEPKSLKDQALEALKHAEEGWRPVLKDIYIIRRALEQLDD